MTTPLARCGTKGVGNKHGQDAFAGLSLSTIVPATSPQNPARPITERMMNTLSTSYGWHADRLSHLALKLRALATGERA